VLDLGSRLLFVEPEDVVDQRMRGGAARAQCGGLKRAYAAATATPDVERLCSVPAISPRVRVSGHVYDVLTGLVETVIRADRRGARADAASATRGRRLRAGLIG
jgi:hypothetical protein